MVGRRPSTKDTASEPPATPTPKTPKKPIPIVSARLTRSRTKEAPSNISVEPPATAFESATKSRVRKPILFCSIKKEQTATNVNPPIKNTEEKVSRRKTRSSFRETSDSDDSVSILKVIDRKGAKVAPIEISEKEMRKSARARAKENKIDDASKGKDSKFFEKEINRNIAKVEAKEMNTAAAEKKLKVIQEIPNIEVEEKKDIAEIHTDLKDIQIILNFEAEQKIDIAEITSTDSKDIQPVLKVEAEEKNIAEIESMNLKNIQEMSNVEEKDFTEMKSTDLKDIQPAVIELKNVPEIPNLQAEKDNAEIDSTDLKDIREIPKDEPEKRTELAVTENVLEIPAVEEIFKSNDSPNKVEVIIDLTEDAGVEVSKSGLKDGVQIIDEADEKQDYSSLKVKIEPIQPIAEENVPTQKAITLEDESSLELFTDNEIHKQEKETNEPQEDTIKIVDTAELHLMDTSTFISSTKIDSQKNNESIENDPTIVMDLRDDHELEDKSNIEHDSVIVTPTIKDIDSDDQNNKEEPKEKSSIEKVSISIPTINLENDEKESAEEKAVISSDSIFESPKIKIEINGKDEAFDTNENVSVKIPKLDTEEIDLTKDILAEENLQVIEDEIINELTTSSDHIESKENVGAIQSMLEDAANPISCDPIEVNPPNSESPEPQDEFYLQLEPDSPENKIEKECNESKIEELAQSSSQSSIPLEEGKVENLINVPSSSHLGKKNLDIDEKLRKDMNDTLTDDNQSEEEKENHEEQESAQVLHLSEEDLFSDEGLVKEGDVKLQKESSTILKSKRNIDDLEQSEQSARTRGTKRKLKDSVDLQLTENLNKHPKKDLKRNTDEAVESEKASKSIKLSHGPSDAIVSNVLYISNLKQNIDPSRVQALSPNILDVIVHTLKKEANRYFAIFNNVTEATYARELLSKHKIGRRPLRVRFAKRCRDGYMLSHHGENILHISKLPLNYVEAQVKLLTNNILKCQKLQISKESKTSSFFITFQDHEHALIGMKALKKITLDSERIKVEFKRAYVEKLKEFIPSKVLVVEGLQGSTSLFDLKSAFPFSTEVLFTSFNNSPTVAILTFPTVAYAKEALERSEGLQIAGSSIRIQYDTFFKNRTSLYNNWLVKKTIPVPE